jgi:hypothetical protein
MAYRTGNAVFPFAANASNPALIPGPATVPMAAPYPAAPRAPVPVQAGYAAPVAPAVPVWLRRPQPVDMRVAPTAPTFPYGFSTTADPRFLYPTTTVAPQAWLDPFDPGAVAPWPRNPRMVRDASFPAVGGGMFEPPVVPGAYDPSFFEQFYTQGYPLAFGPDGRPVTDRYGTRTTAPFLIGMTGTGDFYPLDIHEAEALGLQLTGNPVRQDGEGPDENGAWNYEVLRANPYGEVTGGTAHYDDGDNVDQITINAAPFEYERRQATVHEVAHAIFDVIEADPELTPVLRQLAPRLLEIWQLFNDGAPQDFGYAGESVREGLAEFLRVYDANSAWMDVHFGDVVGTLMQLINQHPDIAEYVQMVYGPTGNPTAA